MAKDDDDKDRDKDRDGGGVATLDADGDVSFKAISAAKRERKRRADIEACVEEAVSYIGADIPAIEKIQAQAVAEGWDVQRAENAILKASRPRAPAPRGVDLPGPKVLEAALCIYCGINDEVLAKDLDYGPEVVTKAWPMRKRGLRGTIAAALETAGVRVPHGSRELFDCLLENQRKIQAEGFSTVNLPGILGAVANKVLLTAFTEVDATYELIADQADFTNFHTHTLYRLDHLGDFAAVPPTGEIKHANLEQTSFTNRLDTAGQMIGLSRQAIINDDLNAFRSLTAQLARKARIAVEKALYDQIMESVDSFYTTARGNRLTTNPLGITELGNAEATMLSMADAGGDPIYAQGKFVLVPPQLKYLADQIYTSKLVNDFTTGKARPTDNPFLGRYIVVSSPYLSLPILDGYSTSAWYFVANPAVLPAFQVAYLDGRRAPTIESADAEFSTLGIQFRCYFDFGCAALDYRGAIKSTP